MIVSILIFVIFGIVCLPIRVSILSNLILGLLVTLGFYLTRDYLDYMELYKCKLQIKIQRGMSLECLNNVLYGVEITPIQYKILKRFYVDRKNLNNIAFELNYSYEYINALKKKALIKVKEFYKL